MTPIERTVLRCFVEDCGADLYWPFAPIERHTKLERRVVRRACRSLARKGLMEYGRGLFTEDGEMAGSGYKATPAGVSALEQEGLAHSSPERSEAVT